MDKLAKEIEPQFKKKLVETFIAFDKFCQENNIVYYAYGGTLIGAVRHKGLIPWDDDIDVLMDKENYDKFCSFRGQVDGHYEILDIKDASNGYWLFTLAKFYDTTTTLVEYQELPFVTGVYIDIFPMYESDFDNARKLQCAYDKYTYKLTYGMMKFSFKDILSTFFHLKRWRLHLMFKHLMNVFRMKTYWKKYNDLLEEIKSQKGDYLVAYDSGKDRLPFKKDWFVGTINLPFEGISINSPAKYHEFLEQIYGDYMTLPPIEQRRSHHSHYYLNLNERLSLKEIRSIKNDFYYNPSL